MHTYYIVAAVLVAVVFYYFYFNKAEGLDNTPIFETPSCGIANDEQNCFTCDDVKEAYKTVGKFYNKKSFQQCQ